jgi:hypothetical protein
MSRADLEDLAARVREAARGVDRLGADIAAATGDPGGMVQVVRALRLEHRRLSNLAIRAGDEPRREAS